MNETEFLQKLSHFEGKFKILRKCGELRTTDDNCLCPILTLFAKYFPNTAKYGLKNSDFYETGGALKLEGKLIWEIVNSADNFKGDRSHYRKDLRMNMLAVLGLTETA